MSILTEEVDLIIVGAGPTGLLSAILARQLGLAVCIIDAKEEPIQVGGADAINPRTQQYLEIASNFVKNEEKKLGILDDFVKRGVKCNTSATYVNGEVTSRQSQWWNSLPHTFYNSFIMIGQPYIERTFVSNLDIPVHYSEPALSFSYTTSPQTVTVETHKRKVTGKYCIAADGARSIIRSELGISWEGTKPNMVWTVIDCWIDTTYPVSREIVALEADGQSRMAWIPRERGMHRFYLLMDGETEKNKVLATMKKYMAPHKVEIRHVEWLSTFEVKERVASSFVYPSHEGPFILAGDAAHVHSVNGGQGLNTGLADAFNLIWRLQLLIQHPNLPSDYKTNLLKSYEIERQATAKEVVDVASQLVRSTMAEAKSYVELIEKNSGFITGMGVNYADVGSPLVVKSKCNIFEAGYRCPDLWLRDSKNRDWCRLYEKIVYGKFVLLLIGDSKFPGVHIKDEVGLTIIRLQPLSEKMDHQRANGGEEGNEGWFECPVIRDGESFAVLVRPDTYIQRVGAVEDMDIC